MAEFSMVFSRLSIKTAVLPIDTWRFPLANNLHRVRGTNQRTAVFLSTNLSMEMESGLLAFTGPPVRSRNGP